MNTLNGAFFSMEELEQIILTADGEDLEEILSVVRRRYGQLYPEHELLLISVDKREDYGAQLQKIQVLLEKL